MKSIAFGVVTSLVIALLIGPSIIKALRKMKFGQKILEDGPTWHMNKQNTPTMGGIIFIAAIIVPIIVLLPAMVSIGDYRPVLMLALSLVFAAIGFVDDYTKIKKKQNKGLTAKQKLLLT